MRVMADSLLITTTANRSSSGDKVLRAIVKGKGLCKWMGRWIDQGRGRSV